VTQTLPGPINTQQIVQPYPYPMNQSCGEVAVGLSLGASGTTTPAAGQMCLSCLINAMQDLPNGESAFGALQICGQQLGKQYFNGGVNGQLILSKYPIKNVKETKLTSIISNRINIHATIKNMKIGFGHWAFNVLADFGPFGQYQAGMTQIDHAKDFVAEGDDIIIGDFNSGLNYQVEGYNYLLNNSYEDLLQPQPVQTWCDPARLNFQLCINAGGYSAAIDHIMVKKSCRLSAKKTHLFNQQPIMSDHIGVASTISKLWFTDAYLEKKIGTSC
jgi:endonuclease/exonuclease/phosphatase family metal-dependent hydrolase